MVIHGVTVTAVTVSAIGKTRFSALEMAGLRVTSEFQGELIVTWQCKTWEHQLMEVPSDAKTDIDFLGVLGVWCATTSYVSDYSTDVDLNFWDFTKKKRQRRALQRPVL
jgi:hypothetical protein